MPIFGINQGAQPIIGYNYGARRFDRVKAALLTALVAATEAGGTERAMIGCARTTGDLNLARRYLELAIAVNPASQAHELLKWIDRQATGIPEPQPEQRQIPALPIAVALLAVTVTLFIFAFLFLR